MKNSNNDAYWHDRENRGLDDDDDDEQDTVRHDAEDESNQQTDGYIGDWEWD